MNSKNSPIWFWTTIALAIALLVVVFWPKGDEEPKIENIINLTGEDDSLYNYYAPYIGYVKAMKLKLDGKNKESQTILATLTRSKNQDISRISNHELKQGPLLIDKEAVIKNAKNLEDRSSSIKKLNEEVKAAQQEITAPITAVAVETKETTEEKTSATSPAKTAGSSSSLSLTSAKGQRLEYKGAMSNQQANGYGVGSYASGSVYKGDWKNNMRDGRGEFKWKDGDVYVGHFVKDYRQGQGTYTFKNGDYYVGGWSQDRRHGQGTLYSKDGKVKKKGIWQNDVLIKESN